MTVVADIFASWRNPRDVIARKLAQGPREDRALATLFGGCGLLFVAQLPGLARAAYVDPAVPFEARLGASLLGLMFVLPLVFYLRSRGVPIKQAQSLLVLAFLAEAIDEIEDNAIADDITARLEGWLHRHES